MEAFGGTLIFGSISHTLTKVDEQVWHYLDKKYVIVNPLDALSFRMLRPVSVAILRTISRQVPLCAASLCAISFIDAIQRQKHQSKEISEEKEIHVSPSDKLALQHVDTVTFAMSTAFNLLTTENESCASSWFGELTNSKFDQALTCIGGLVAFHGASFLPILRDIRLIHAGKFAMRFLPATKSYATTKQRGRINKLGNLYGCHTCGDGSLLNQMFYFLKNKEFKVVKFHSDHIPPISTVKQLNLSGKEGTQRFYPQCVACSQKQSQACARLKKNQILPIIGYKIASQMQTHAVGALLAGGATMFRRIDGPSS